MLGMLGDHASSAGGHPCSATGVAGWNDCGTRTVLGLSSGISGSGWASCSRGESMSCIAVGVGGVKHIGTCCIALKWPSWPTSKFGWQKFAHPSWPMSNPMPPLGTEADPPNPIPALGTEADPHQVIGMVIGGCAKTAAAPSSCRCGCSWTPCCEPPSAAASGMKFFRHCAIVEVLLGCTRIGTSWCLAASVASACTARGSCGAGSLAQRWGPCACGSAPRALSASVTCEIAFSRRCVSALSPWARSSRRACRLPSAWVALSLSWEASCWAAAALPTQSPTSAMSEERRWSCSVWDSSCFSSVFIRASRTAPFCARASTRAARPSKRCSHCEVISFSVLFWRRRNFPRCPVVVMSATTEFKRVARLSRSLPSLVMAICMLMASCACGAACCVTVSARAVTFWPSMVILSSSKLSLSSCVLSRAPNGSCAGGSWYAGIACPGIWRQNPAPTWRSTKLS
mmetsp:Transcript_109537/g.309888  ORF Transcript_109537/g.309888 Transcript_109537/m.309888 type:complete len:457 (-) Transcript_109537:56-1426(-)